jgi:hypothetical protein
LEIQFKLLQEIRKDSLAQLMQLWEKNL